jgi:hypothetical protein
VNLYYESMITGFRITLDSQSYPRSLMDCNDGSKLYMKGMLPPYGMMYLIMTLP